jgi:hypothetical protein
MKYFRFFAALIALTFSCNFEPDTEVFTDINPPDVSGLSIDLNSYPEEEILLTEVTTFYYSIETNGKEHIETRVTIDGEIIWITSSSINGSFTLNPEELGTGNHDLKIEFVAASKTGSLAEQYGAEVLYVWTERNIIVDLTIPDDPGDPGAIVIQSVIHVDNSIQVNWSKYSNPNFEQYELLRVDYDANGNIIQGSPILFGAGLADITTYNDRTYVGGKSEYMIKLYAANQTYTSPPFVYEHPYKPNVSYEINGDGSVTVSWNSLAQLSENFRGYTLKLKYEVGGFTQTTTFTSSALMDTTETFTPPDFKFGDVKNLEFSLDPVSTRQPLIYYSKLRYGDSFPAFQPVFVEPQFNEETQTYFLAKNSLLYKISETGELLDSLSTHYPKISLNKTIGVATKMDDKLVKIDLETMEVESLPGLPDGNIIDLSEDNRAVVFTSFDGLKVFDLQGATLATIGFQPGLDIMKISPDGNWLLTPGIRKWNGVDQYELWSAWLASGYRSVDFLENQPPTMIVGYNNRVMKMNLETLGEVTSNSYTGPCNIDNTTGLIGCLTGNQFVILNDNFELQKSLPVDVTAGYFYLLNNTVLCTSGTQIKVSDIP